MPTGNAPTTSEWSVSLLPKLILEIWQLLHTSTIHCFFFVGNNYSSILTSMVVKLNHLWNYTKDSYGWIIISHCYIQHHILIYTPCLTAYIFIALFGEDAITMPIQNLKHLIYPVHVLTCQACQWGPRRGADNTPAGTPAGPLGNKKKKQTYSDTRIKQPYIMWSLEEGGLSWQGE